MKQLYNQLTIELNFIQERMKEYANQQRIGRLTLKKGNKVYLLWKNICTNRLSNKLDFKKIGPFEILEKISIVNYKLKLL